MKYRLQQTIVALLLWTFIYTVSAVAANTSEGSTSDEGIGVEEVVQLRTAAQRSAPKYFQSDGGAAVQGLCVDIIEAIQQQAPNILISGHQQFLPSSRIYAELRSGKLDIFCGSGKTIERQQQVHYLMPPLYTVQHRMVAKIDDPVEVHSFADLSSLEDNGLVLTYLNSATHHFLLRQPGLHINEGSSLDNLFERLQLDRGRFIYYHDLGLNYYIDSQQLINKVRMLPGVFNRYDHYLVASKKLPKTILDQLESALQALHLSGRLEQLHRRYAPVSEP